MSTFNATVFLRDEAAGGVWLGDLLDAQGEPVAEVAWMPLPRRQSPASIPLGVPLLIEGTLHQGLSLVTIEPARIEVSRCGDIATV